MPIPTVKDKERTRTKSGRWRKKRSDTTKSRKTKEKIEGSINQIREPDIAFWFDEDFRYMVKIRDGVTHIELVQACFDLLAKAVRRDLDTVIGEFKD